MNDNAHKVVFSQAAMGKASDCWATPRNLIRAVEERWGLIGLDAAALRNTAVTEHYFGPDHWDQDRREAFYKSWASFCPRFRNIWLNPPYKKKTINDWFDKVIEEASKLHWSQSILVLIPARTSNIWFFEKVMNEPLCHEVCFIKGRLTFLEAETMEPVRDKKGKPTCAPFPSMILRYVDLGLARRGDYPEMTALELPPG